MDSEAPGSSQISSRELHDATAVRPASIRTVPPVAELDGAILEAFPTESEILSVTQHGDTHWSTGLRVDTRTQNGDKSYFVKIIDREDLVGMAEAEYEGQKAIAELIPTNSVKPVSWGYLQGTRAKSWFLAQYRSLRAGPPPLEQLLPIVRQMHQASASPNGKFGFHVTPFYGPPPMQVGWLDNWEQFWIREFRSGLAYVETMCGHDAELMALADDFIQKVAVRLLRPLQTGGRSIKPSLCHGDLWDGNIQIDADTGEPVIFDPCVFYGHHEMDFQCMRSPRYTVGNEFIELYRENVGASEPVEDFEDRIALYAIRNDLMTAGMWPKWSSLVGKAKEEMRRLLDKYPEGISSFQGSLEPTNIPQAEYLTTIPAPVERLGPSRAAPEAATEARVPGSSEDSRPQKTEAKPKILEDESSPTTRLNKRRLSLKLNFFKNMVRELKRGMVR